MNQKSLCARTWKPVDADSLVKLVVCDPLAISGRSGKLWKGNSIHFLVSLTQNQTVTKLIMSWILRVNCSGSGSWFPHRTSWKTWRPVPWDLSVLSDMSVDRQEEWLELQLTGMTCPDRPHRTVVCNHYAVSRTRVPNICKAVKMVNELLLWRTGYLLANCVQELTTNLKMQLLFNIVTHRIFLSRLQMFS